ncbi:hypothetical protein, partial [Robertkochia marina]
VDFDANTLNIVDNLDGTYDFTDEVGTVIATVNTSAASNSYSNATSGLAATNVQAAIDEIIAIGAADADGDPTNEIQDITTDGTAGNLSLSSGSTLTLNVDDPDADATNEIQDLGEVLLEGNDAGGSVITNLGVPTLASDATTKQYVDDAITASDQVVVSTDANNDVIAGVDGGAYYDDPDADATNEIQDLGEVLLEGNDAGGSVITNLGVPTLASDAT